MNKIEGFSERRVNNVGGISGPQIVHGRGEYYLTGDYDPMVELAKAPQDVFNSVPAHT